MNSDFSYIFSVKLSKITSYESFDEYNFESDVVAYHPLVNENNVR